VSGLIWYRHDGLDVVAQQPKDAQPQLAQSGWFPLPAEDVAALEQAAADAVAADEKAMTESAARAAAPPEIPATAPPRGETPHEETE